MVRKPGRENWLHVATPSLSVKSAFSVARTEPGCFVGKLLYFSPEYLLGEPIGPTLDLYALGVTLWLALTGAAPWPGADEGRVARAIVSEGVPDLGEHVTVAPEVRTFVAKACSRDPLARHQSAREMAAALEHFDRHHGWVATHGEVARVVERLLGASLRERREKILRKGKPPVEAVFHENDHGVLDGRGRRDVGRELAALGDPLRPAAVEQAHVRVAEQPEDP